MPDRRRALALVAALTALFVADRALIAATHSHLLFHYDRAEYAFYGAIAPSLEANTVEALFDRHGPYRLAARSIQVGDMGLHGTTVLAGAALHAAVVHGGASVSTWTLKKLAIGGATIALLLWLALLLRTWASPPAAAAFGLLFVFGPLPLVKLNLLFWGTHELVLLLAAALFLGTLPRLAEDDEPSPAFAVGVGAASAVLFGMNFSLLLPCAFVIVALRRRAVHAAATFVVCWVALASIPAVADLGYARWPLGNPRVEEIATRWYGPGHWPSALAVTPWLIPGLLAAGWTLAGRTAPDTLERHPVTRLLAAYLLFAWGAVVTLPMGWLAGEGGPVFQHRFAATLYPVSIAVIVAWGLSRRPAVGRSALAALLLAGVAAQLTAAGSANFGVASRYDGAALYCHLRGEDCRTIPRDRFALADASPRFLDGLAYLTRHQKLEQLEWIDRTEHRDVPVDASVLGWIRDGSRVEPDADRAEFLRGVGYALRLLHPPPSRRDRLDPLWPRLGAADGPHVWAGYAMAPLR